MIVEDEDAVRTITRRLLESFGYRVVDANLPDRALAIAAAMDGSIDLILTDVVMPGMDGRQLATRLEHLLPGTRVLYMSGYVDSPERYGIDRRCFIQKPFTPAELAGKVREAIDARDWS